MKHIFCHIEIPTKDLERCKNFYTGLFKWKVKTFEANYYEFSTGAEPGGGLMKMEEFRPGFINYILVDKMEPFLEKIPQLGGQILKGKTEIPNHGWYAIVADPDGNQFGLFASLPKPKPKPKKLKMVAKKKRRR